MKIKLNTAGTGDAKVDRVHFQVSATTLHSVTGEKRSFIGATSGEETVALSEDFPSIRAAGDALRKGFTVPEGAPRLAKRIVSFLLKSGQAEEL